MKKIYFIKALLIASVIFIVAISAGAVAADIVTSSIKPPEKNIVTEIYIVKEGDTIRSIALQYCTPEINPNFVADFLQEIQQLNPGLRPGNLHEGDKIKLHYRRKAQQ